MAEIIWARPLTDNEASYFYKSDLGKKHLNMGALAVMGLETHPSIQKQNVKRYFDRTYLGGGQYFDDALSSPPLPVGGRKTSIKFSGEVAYIYLLQAAEKSNVEFIYDQDYPSYKWPLYFKAKFLDAFVDGFDRAESLLQSWHQSRPLADRWFGGTAPLINTPEARNILKGVQDVFANFRR